jgi:excisionase family DNA binding protein
MPNAPKFLSAKEVADRIDVHRETLYRQIKRGEIPGARKIGGEWKIPRWSLDEMGTPAHLATA